MEKFYVYKHCKPGTNEVFYIGKGCGSRAYDKGRNQWWKNIVSKYGGFDVHFISDNLSNEDAILLEKQIISEMGRRDLGTGPLVNLTDGGEGAAGAIKSNETRARMSVACKGKNLDRKFSEEHNTFQSPKSHSFQIFDKLSIFSDFDPKFSCFCHFTG